MVKEQNIFTISHRKYPDKIRLFFNFSIFRQKYFVFITFLFQSNSAYYEQN